MLVVAFLGWWYSIGWLMVIRKTAAKVQRVLQFFSVEQLLGSLFAPFRQISAGRVQGPLGVQLRAWGDRLFSRIIGAIVRLLLVGVGFLVALTILLFGIVLLVVWPLLPAFPLLGMLVMITGYAP
jgi:hypothetical protein